MLQAIAYLVLLRRHAGEHLGLSSLFSSLVRMVGACLPAMTAGIGIAKQGVWSEGPTTWNVCVLAAAGVVGGLGYGMAAYILEIEEVQTIVRRLSRRFRR